MLQYSMFPAISICLVSISGVVLPFVHIPPVRCKLRLQMSYIWLKREKDYMEEGTCKIRSPEGP